MGSKYQLLLLTGFIAVFAQVPAYAMVDWNWNGVPTNQAELDKAMQFYQAGDADSAIGTLNNMKNGPNQDVRAAHILVDIYREQKRYGEAVKELQDLANTFTKFIATHNVSPPWMNPASLKIEMGDVAGEQGNTSEALSLYREAMAASPILTTQARSQMGKIYEMQGDFENARQQYKSITEQPTLSSGEKKYYLDRISLIDKRIAEGGQPGAQPGGQPGMQPGGQPGMQPGGQPGMQPGGQPGMQPGGQPGMRPTMQPGGSSSIATGPGPMQPRPVAGTGPLQIAADEIATKKYDAAITRLKAVLQKTPANAQAHYLLAVAYASSRQISSAREEYEATLKYAQDMKLQKLASAGLTKLQGKP